MKIEPLPASARGSFPASWLATAPILLPIALLCFLAVQADPEITGAQWQPTDEVLVRASATSGEYYRLDVTEHFETWDPLVTLRSAGNDQHLDSAAPYRSRRFYRTEAVAGTNVLTGDHLVTSAGNVVIHPVNHASFVMSWNGLMIYNDPVGGSAPYQSFPRADLMLVSHTHNDHYHAGTLDAVRNTGGVIVAPQAVFDSMSAGLRAVTTVLANGGTTAVMGISIEAVPAYNAYHEPGVGNGYVITIGDKRLYMSGDTGDIAEMRALENIDVAFVCMNVPFTMNITQAASAVRDFAPKVIYPYHFRNQTGTLADLNSFKQMVGQDLGIEVRVRTWY